MHKNRFRIQDFKFTLPFVLSRDVLVIKFVVVIYDRRNGNMAIRRRAAATTPTTV